MSLTNTELFNADGYSHYSFCYALLQNKYSYGLWNLKYSYQDSNLHHKYYMNDFVPLCRNTRTSEILFADKFTRTSTWSSSKSLVTTSWF